MWKEAIDLRRNQGAAEHPGRASEEVVSELSSQAGFAALGRALTGRVAGMTWWRA